MHSIYIIAATMIGIPLFHFEAKSERREASLTKMDTSDITTSASPFQPTP
jgi:hypothetical protein